MPPPIPAGFRFGLFGNFEKSFTFSDVLFKFSCHPWLLVGFLLYTFSWNGGSGGTVYSVYELGSGCVDVVVYDVGPVSVDE